MDPAKGVGRGIGKLPVAQGRERVAAHAGFLGERPQGAATNLVVAAVPIDPLDEVGFQRVDRLHHTNILPDTLGGVKSHIGRSIHYANPMKKRQNPAPGLETRTILADNLKKLMEENPQFGSERALGKAAKVGASSVGNMRHPTQGNPTIDNIAKVAAVFGLQAWQLLHRDMPARAMTDREVMMYDAIERAYKALPPLDPSAKKSL